MNQGTQMEEKLPTRMTLLVDHWLDCLGEYEFGPSQVKCEAVQWV